MLVSLIGISSYISSIEIDVYTIVRDFFIANLSMILLFNFCEGSVLGYYSSCKKAL